VFANPFGGFLCFTGLKDAPQEERDPHFQEKINELFVDTRRIIIDNFSDGLTLGGHIDWVVGFQLLPPAALSKIALYRGF
jgi:hypothetical protein